MTDQHDNVTDLLARAAAYAEEYMRTGSQRAARLADTSLRLAENIIVRELQP